MAVNFPVNATAPKLDLSLPSSASDLNIILTNNTLGKSLTIDLDNPWDGSDLTLDFAAQQLLLPNGSNRNDMISGDLWTPSPLLVGANDVTIQVVAATSVTSSGPNSPGTVTDVDLFGAPAWSNPSNATSSNNSYATISLADGQISDFLQATNFGFAIPSGATISGIKAEVERSDSGTGGECRDLVVRIVKGGVIGSTDRALADPWPSSDAYASYGGSSDLWGETWTRTDINASNFGFAIAARVTSSPFFTPAPRIDHIRMTVYYTTAGTPAAYGATAGWRWNVRSF